MKQYRTMACQSGRVRALEKNWNTRKNWLRRLQNFARRDMMRSRPRRVACQQEKSNVFCVVRGITGSWTQREKVVNSLIFRIDLFSSVFATFAGSSGDRIHTEVNCQIVVSDFFKVIPQYCIAHPFYARFSRHQRAQISACTYTTKEISLKLSTIAK